MSKELEKEIQNRLVEILSDKQNKEVLKKHMELEMIGYPHGIHVSETGKLKIVEVITENEN